MIKTDNRCDTCGGAVDRKGRTLAPATRVPSPRPPRAAPAAPAGDDDAGPHLSPVERFKEAIVRRDRLIREQHG